MMYKEYYNYLVYEDGRLFSKYCNRFLKGDLTKHGYISYTLSINKESVCIKAHRLVAMLFLDNPNNYPIVNHIDGNKLNNHYSNLEWCSYYHNNKHARDMGLNNISKSNSDRWKDDEFRKRASKNISKGIILSGCSKGRNNPKFRYSILHNGKEISRQELCKICNKALSTVDAGIREYCQGKYIDYFVKNNIHIIDTKAGQSTIKNTIIREIR